MMRMTTTGNSRVYGGVDATARESARRRAFLDAGLQRLGTGQGSLTVRGVCSEAGLVARYFYESFSDGDDLVVAVYDEVIEGVVLAALAALSEAPADEREQVRAALGAVVTFIADDPRKGRLLFDTAVRHPALTRKRLESIRLFSAQLAQRTRDFYGIESSVELETVSRFLVGGFGETLIAWQHGDLDLSQDALVEQCTQLFQASAAPLLGR